MRKSVKVLFNEVERESIEPLVDALIDEMLKAPPPGSLVSEEQWRQRHKEELMEQLSFRELRERLLNGFDALRLDLRQNLSQGDFDEFREELLSGLGRLRTTLDEVDTIGQFPESPELTMPRAGSYPDPLQAVMGFYEKGMREIYQAGYRYYELQQAQEAANVFLVLNTLDYRRYSAWLALGFAELDCERIEHALNAFSMASLMEIEAPQPYLQTALCYLKLGDCSDAKECIGKAERLMRGLKGEDLAVCRHTLTQCRQLLRNGGIDGRG